MDATHRHNAPDFNGRIPYLDAFRGIAVVAVVLYHGFRRWNAIEPYDHFTPLANFLSGFGNAGVILFFCISGYVILLTLDRTPGFGKFVANRWLRLFPKYCCHYQQSSPALTPSECKT